MEARLLSLDETNRMLPLLRHIVRDIMEHWNLIIGKRAELEALEKAPRSAAVDEPKAQEVKQDLNLLIDKINHYIKEVESLGCFVEEFKRGIKHLIVQEFFTREHIERFFQGSGAATAEGISANIDFDRVFEHLGDAIAESPMGGMLNMLGGRKALEPLKEPVIAKLKGVI
ncbi:MAG TPA: DUF2203 family protein, partial [Planctomycetota bacterium]|nr:DUF2203 family protein [Planctomycetota bacterium]